MAPELPEPLAAEEAEGALLVPVSPAQTRGRGGRSGRDQNHRRGEEAANGGSPPGPFYLSKWSDPVGFMTGADACGASG